MRWRKYKWNLHKSLHRETPHKITHRNTSTHEILNLAEKGRTSGIGLLCQVDEAAACTSLGTFTHDRAPDHVDVSPLSSPPHDAPATPRCTHTQPGGLCLVWSLSDKDRRASRATPQPDQTIRATADPRARAHDVCHGQATLTRNAGVHVPTGHMTRDTETRARADEKCR